MTERATTEKYVYSPKWIGRAKRAEGGGMSDSDGFINNQAPPTTSFSGSALPPVSDKVIDGTNFVSHGGWNITPNESTESKLKKLSDKYNNYQPED